MRHLSCVHLSAALLALAALIDRDGGSAELEGALQYPPRSIGEAAPPAKMLPQPVSPWRIELGVSGSSVPPTQQFYIRSPPRLDRPAGPPESASGR